MRSAPLLSLVAVALVLSAPLAQASPAGKKAVASWPPKTGLRVRARGVLPTLSLLRNTVTESLRLSRDAGKWRSRDQRRGNVTSADRNARATDIDKRLEAFGKKTVRSAGIKLVVEGAENLKDLDGGAIIIANHESHLDGPIILSMMDVLGPTRVAGSQHLFEVPILGNAMKDAGIIAIDRKNTATAKEALAKAATELGEDTNLLIFPEGGRSRGAPLPLKKGAFHQALNMKRPILPIRLEGVGEVLPADAKVVRPGKQVRVIIGKPISGDSVNELKARSEAFFEKQGVRFPPAPAR